MNSSLGCADLESPETNIVKILVADGESRSCPLSAASLVSASSQRAYSGHCSSAIVSASTANSQLDKADVLARIEALLICGQRDEAATLAADHAEWGLAILVGGICSPEKYKEIALRYSNHSFPLNSTLNVLCKMLSNQSDVVLLRDPSFVSNWRRNAAAIISNKSADWASRLVSIGDRLRDDASESEISIPHPILALTLTSPSASSIDPNQTTSWRRTSPTSRAACCRLPPAETASSPSWASTARQTEPSPFCTRAA